MTGFKEESDLNCEMVGILKEVEQWMKSACASLVYPFKRFFFHYAPSGPACVSWEEVCQYASENPGSNKLAAKLIILLLDSELYDQDHKTALTAFRDTLANALENLHPKCLPSYLCGALVDCFSDAGKAEFVLTFFDDELFRTGTTINLDMVDILRKVAKEFYGDRMLASVNKDSRRAFRRFFYHYCGQSPEDVSWTEVCDASESGKWTKQWSLMLILVLLDENLYKREFADVLVNLKGDMRYAIRIKGRNIGPLLCGSEVRSLMILTNNIETREYWRLECVHVATGSPFFKKMIASFLQSSDHSVGHITQKSLSVLLASFGQDAQNIASVVDFTAELFWRQARFLRERYSGDKSARVRYASFLRRFYQYLAESHPELELFSKSTSLSYDLLRNDHMTGYIAGDVKVTVYAPGIDLGDEKISVLILRGCEDLSTSVRSEDSIALDLSSLESSLYRREVLAYFCAFFKRTVGLAKNGGVSVFATCMQFLYEMKRHDGYPNPSLVKFTNQEIMLLRRSIDQGSQGAVTKAGYMTLIRKFLQWEKDVRKAFVFESFALDHLDECPSSGSAAAQAIPDSELALLSNHLEKNAEHDPLGKLVFAVFHLLLQTELRVGQVCALEVDCIKPSIKPKQYVIYSASKTSRGEKEPVVITTRTHRLLLDVIDATNEIREECLTGSLGRSIFVFRNRSHRPWRVSTNIFSRYLKKCCDDLGIDYSYTAANLRDTHMTKSLEFASRSGELKSQAKILTGHKKLDTTVSRYLDLEIEKMLESTYDILIGDSLQIDADGKILEFIPEEASGPESSVEDGCGNCTAKACVLASSLPCLVCEHFVTTVDHENYFIHAIEVLDAKLKNAESRHDVEDLVTMKRLHAAYLKAIYTKKELANASS